MIYYMKDDSKYLDFNTLKEITGRSRSYLEHYLLNDKVTKIYYKNRLLLNLEDLLKSKEINKFL